MTKTKPTPPETRATPMSACLSVGYLDPDLYGPVPLVSESVSELKERADARWRAQRKHEAAKKPWWKRIGW